MRPLYDDSSEDPSAVTRDYVLEIDSGLEIPPVLSIFGGKITIYRKLAEHALQRLSGFRDYFRHEPRAGAFLAVTFPAPSRISWSICGTNIRACQTS